MKNRIRIHLGYYFPATFIFLGAIMFLMGVALVLDYPLISIILFPVSLFIFTTRYQLEINLTDRTYHDYLWMAGFRKGKKKKFARIEGLYMTKNKYSQTINSRISSMTHHGIEYNGYIAFDVDKEHLISHDNKAKVMRKLKKISKRLSGDVILSTGITICGDIMDYTEESVP